MATDPIILNSEPAPPPAEANIGDPTGLPIDNIDTEASMSDEAIREALGKAMRGEDTGLDLDLEDNGWDQSGAEGTPRGADGDDANGGDPAGAVDPEAGSGQESVGSPIPDPSDPAPTPTPPLPTDAIDPALSPIPPGMVQVPIEEIDPLTGQTITRLHVIPANEVGGLLGWANSLSENERQIIAQTIEQMRTGATPVSPYPAASGSGPNTPAPGSLVPGAGAGTTPPAQFGAIDPATGLPHGIDPADVDPGLLAVIRTQQAQIQQVMQSQAEFQQTQADFQARQMQEDRARMQAEIDSTVEEFATARNLTPEQVAILKDKAAATQYLPVAMQKNYGNVRTATMETLNMTYWATEEFRQHAIEQELSTVAATQQDTAARKQRAASLAGGGAAVARVAPPAKPLTKAERDRAMATELQVAMANGTAQ